VEFIHSEKLQISNAKNYEKSFNRNIPLLFNIIKNAKAIDNLRENIFEDIDLTDKKILIIDDESDFGSINIGKSENKSSVLYGSIEKIFNRFYNPKLLKVTATPYGNILNSNSMSLKIRKIFS
jgi:hypothetical protein